MIRQIIILLITAKYLVFCQHAAGELHQQNLIANNFMSEYQNTPTTITKVIPISMVNEPSKQVATSKNNRFDIVSGDTELVRQKRKYSFERYPTKEELKPFSLLYVAPELLDDNQKDFYLNQIINILNFNEQKYLDGLMKKILNVSPQANKKFVQSKTTIPCHKCFKYNLKQLQKQRQPKENTFITFLPQSNYAGNAITKEKRTKATSKTIERDNQNESDALFGNKVFDNYEDSNSFETNTLMHLLQLMKQY